MIFSFAELKGWQGVEFVFTRLSFPIQRLCCDPWLCSEEVTESLWNDALQGTKILSLAGHPKNGIQHGGKHLLLWSSGFPLCITEAFKTPTSCTDLRGKFLRMVGSPASHDYWYMLKSQGESLFLVGLILQDPYDCWGGMGFHSEASISLYLFS